MYTEEAAARLLRIAPSTLHWWLEGRSPRYRPVIRAEPTGSRNVTWAEFVEAGLLRSYRREHDVPLKELRDFIDRLRDEFQVPYPLADRRPYVGPGRRLLIDLQDRSHLDPEFCLVAMANGQIVLTAPGEQFYERVDWSGDEPAGWRPHEDPVSPVRINPLVRFGMPAIGGISTEAIAGELDGGASLEEVADDFGLDIDAVRWAQSYELSQRAPRQPLPAADPCPIRLRIHAPHRVPPSGCRVPRMIVINSSYDPTSVVLLAAITLVGEQRHPPE